MRQVRERESGFIMAASRSLLVSCLKRCLELSTECSHLPNVIAQRHWPVLISHARSTSSRCDATCLVLDLSPRLGSALVLVPRHAWSVWVLLVVCLRKHQSEDVSQGLWIRVKS
ncbi:hypothetical protein Krac_3799 [Ktedonobacter racemifer DSM 44963]|uniref:Uncharacterized protein n=1 Tax=Ktedonobacter racemifer DSM 44963 TaxID=485913 RepID=D6U309_KTERA|nr:hypothetical protein Krac_3799 [Ktedonobacter racemifer DSM 44963]